MSFTRIDFDVCCEWGKEGIEKLSPSCDTVVIVDVLSFSTCVEIALSKGAVVYPYQFKDESAKSYAQSLAAELAVPRGSTAGFSLSPRSLMAIPENTKLVLPSPNGSTLALSTNGVPTFAGCFRNARAVAQAVQSIGKRVCVIPAGEQWSDGTLRVAAEDLIGAGAIVHYLNGRKSPEAELAAACFERAQSSLLEFLYNCTSGKELIDRGFESDVSLACQLNESACVPVLKDGAFVEIGFT